MNFDLLIQNFKKDIVFKRYDGVSDDILKISFKHYYNLLEECLRDCMFCCDNGYGAMYGVAVLLETLFIENRNSDGSLTINENKTIPLARTINSLSIEGVSQGWENERLTLSTDGVLEQIDTTQGVGYYALQYYQKCKKKLLTNIYISV